MEKFFFHETSPSAKMVGDNWLTPSALLVRLRQDTGGLPGCPLVHRTGASAGKGTPCPGARTIEKLLRSGTCSGPPPLFLGACRTPGGGLLHPNHYGHPGRPRALPTWRWEPSLWPSTSSLNYFFLFSACSSHSLLQLNPDGVGSASWSTPSSAMSHTGSTRRPGEKPPLGRGDSVISGHRSFPRCQTWHLPAQQRGLTPDFGDGRESPVKPFPAGSWYTVLGFWGALDIMWTVPRSMAGGWAEKGWEKGRQREKETAFHLLELGSPPTQPTCHVLNPEACVHISSQGTRHFSGQFSDGPDWLRICLPI